MKFTLIYDGDLPSSGNQSKALEASIIRNAFHDQLADLWDSHVIFRQLARTARANVKRFAQLAYWNPPTLSEFQDPIRAPIEGEIDLCAPIEVPNVGKFIPAVRKSLYLACELDILFLRHEEPFALLKQGGDLDGRLKTLFDALRMPNELEAKAGRALTAEPLYVLLEDDAMVTDFSIKSGRLLGDRAKKRHAVRLTIDVTVKVLRIFPANQCLIGG